MKSILLTTFFALFMTLSVHAQFALEAGYNSNSAEVEALGLTLSASDEGGVYFGASYDIALGDKLAIQPALLYSADAFQVPVSVKLNLGGDFSLLAGPSLLLLSGEDTETDGFNKNGLGYTTGISYSVSDKIALVVRFSGDFDNRFESTDTILGDSSVKYTQFKAGISYQF